MISKLKVRDRKRICIKWWNDVKFLQRDEFEFGPGLTILFGPNGSGKSTLLLGLAEMTFCRDGGRSVVTHEAGVPLLRSGFMSRREHLSAREYYQSEFADGLVVEHDGQSVSYFDPSRRVGLMGGSFDDNFFEEGLRNAIAKESSGQGVLRRMGAAAGVLAGADPGPFRWNWAWKNYYDEWVEDGRPEFSSWTDRIRSKKDKRIEHDPHFSYSVEAVERLTLPSIPKGPPTVLLDEPDQSLQLFYQWRMWQMLADAAKKCQIIVATHSPFALGIEGATYLEVVPGYLDECRYVARKLAKQFPQDAGADEKFEKSFRKRARKSP